MEDKQYVDGLEVVQSIHIGDREVLLLEGKPHER
jgi:hypothetical protein